MEAYQRYGPALLRKCERMLNNRQDAEDVVHGLFVDLLKKGQTMPDLPYLYRAVTNRCINHIRYGNNRRRLLAQHDQMLRGPIRTPCDELVIGIDMLLKATEQMDERSIEILVYRFFDDMTQEEIGHLLGLSRRSVNKRLKKLTAQLQLLARDGQEAAHE